MNVGDIVTLRTGGLRMTITNVVVVGEATKVTVAFDAPAESVFGMGSGRKIEQLIFDSRVLVLPPVVEALAKVSP